MKGNRNGYSDCWLWLWARSLCQEPLFLLVTQTHKPDTMSIPVLIALYSPVRKTFLSYSFCMTTASLPSADGLQELAACISISVCICVAHNWAEPAIRSAGWMEIDPFYSFMEEHSKQQHRLSLCLSRPRTLSAVWEYRWDSPNSLLCLLEPWKPAVILAN